MNDRTGQTVPPLQDLTGLAVSLALAFGVAAVGGWVTAGSVTSWYPTLAKPSFNPPDWVFGPVWTALYTLMAVAAWRVWRKTGPLRQRALALYGTQLALNLLWSTLFFGLNWIGAALIEIVLLLAAIVATGRAFRSIDRLAGLCFVPYAAWVAFALVLNAAIWRLN